VANRSIGTYCRPFAEMAVGAFQARRSSPFDPVPIVSCLLAGR
jgi:hypothetical protein